MNPAHGYLILFLVLLLFLFLIRFSLIAEPIQLPDKWYASGKQGKQKKLYLRGTITEVLKPGAYLADLEILDFDKYKSKKNNKYRFKKKNKEKQSDNNKIKETTNKKKLFIPVYIQINDYYLFNTCRLWLNLVGKSLPQRLAKNGFGDYLKKKGAVSLLRLSRKNIYRKDCRKLDLRGKFQNALGFILYKSGFNLYERGLALGLLLGRSSYMQKTLKQKAKELGILHLFAASGLHMGIFYLWVYWPLYRLRGKKSKIALALPLIPCFIYMFLLGFPISLIRSFSFLSFHALQSFLYRQISTKDLLLNSAICVLFLQPKSFISLATFLSFGAVSGILYFYNIIWKQLLAFRLGPAKIIFQQSTISIAASLFTTPLILFVFGAYSYSSLLANLLLVPFVGVLMPLLIAGILLALLSNGTFIFIIKFSRLLIEYFIFLTDWLAGFSLYINYNSLFCMPFFATILLIVSLLSLEYYWPKKIINKTKYKILLSIAFICLLVLSPLGGIIEKYLFKGAKYF